MIVDKKIGIELKFEGLMEDKALPSYTYSFFRADKAVNNLIKEIYCLLNLKIIKGKSISDTALSDYDFYRLEFIPIIEKIFLTMPEAVLLNEISMIDKQANMFQVIIDNKQKTCILGPIGNIRIQSELRGYGIGSYMLSRLIKVLKENGYSDFSVSEGSLSSVDAKDEENRKRRNLLYRNRGFHVEDDETGNGKFWADKISDLSEYYNSKKIIEINISDFIGNIIRDDNNIKKDKQTLNNIINSLREEKPMKPEYIFSNYQWILIILLLIIILQYFFCHY